MRSLSRGGIRAAVFQLCPVCELAPFSCPRLPRNWRQGGSFPPRPVGESAPCPRTVCPGSGVRTAVPRLCPVGELASFSRTVCPGSGVRAAVFRSVRWVNQRPVPVPSASKWRPGGSLSPCRMGGHQNRLSHALRRFKLRNSLLFSRSFAFMREKRKMYSVQKFPCPSGTIASALKIVPKPIDNLRRVLYNATMLLR